MVLVLPTSDKPDWYVSTKMQTWVSLTEAEALVSGYPVTIPDSYDTWLNQAYLLIARNPSYSFPTDVSEDMKLALSLYACIIASGQNQNLQANGVSSFTIGNFSQTYSDKFLTGLDKYPEPIQSLLAQYRTGKAVTSRLTRTYPRN